MKGLIPWIRELFFGPRCKYVDSPILKYYCTALPLDKSRCSSGYCWKHHYELCMVFYKNPDGTHNGKVYSSCTKAAQVADTLKNR